MDAEKFVQNIKRYCTLKNIKPTVACRESGVGTSFINNIEARNQTPSVAKVQQLAAYLGVTTSELLGEDVEVIRLPGQSLGQAQPDLLIRFSELTPAGQKEVLAFVEFKYQQEQGKRQKEEKG